jgi:SAM-dependent methyltransferase
MYALDNFLLRYSNLVSQRQATVSGGGSEAESLELELRFKQIDHEDFLKVVDLLASEGFDARVSRSVVFLVRVDDKDTESILREITFDDCKTDTYRRKINMIDPVHDDSKIVPYKISCCVERPEAPCDISKCSIIRVKMRLVFTKPGSPWRYDLTVMKRMEPRSADSLQTVIKKMFARPIRDDYVAADLRAFLREREKLYTYEIEAEFEETNTVATIVDVNDAVIKIVGGINPAYMQEALFREQILKIADSIGYQGHVTRYTLKEILPQVVSLGRREYQDIYPPTGWTITEKLDGVRAALVCSGGPVYVVTSEVSQLLERCETAFVAEGELVDGVLYLFDVMLFDTDLVYKYSYTARLAYIPKIIELLALESVTTKHFVTLSGEGESAVAALKAGFAELEKETLGLPTDGIIFVEDNKEYLRTTSYKWKPLEQTTIDFLAKRYDFHFSSAAGGGLRAGYDLYFLFVGINVNMFNAVSMKLCQNYSKLFEGLGNRSYFPVQFSPSSCPMAFVYYHPASAEPIDGKIVEMGLTDPEEPCGKSGTPDWELIRVREDRTRDFEALNYFGNDFRVAELTWNNFLDPLPRENLWEGVGASYFQEEKASVYRPQVFYLSFIKTQRIRSIARSDWVVDLGCGKGQDLNRYFQNGIRHLVCVDSDRAALAELVKRKFDIIRKLVDSRRSRGKVTFHAHGGTQVTVVPADIGDRKRVTDEIFHYAPKEGVNVVVCNLAVHYFMGSAESMSRFVMLCRDLLRPGGTLVLLMMSGERVFEKLKDVAFGESWDVHQDGALKNRITRRYSEKRLMPAGQKIGVLLPFSRGELYEENLVNTKALIAELVKRGFTVEGDAAVPVTNRMYEYESDMPDSYKQLTEEDHLYLNLFVELVATRK